MALVTPLEVIKQKSIENVDMLKGAELCRHYLTDGLGAGLLRAAAHPRRVLWRQTLTTALSMRVVSV